MLGQVKRCFHPSQWWSDVLNPDGEEGCLMWVYRNAQDGSARWEVGFFYPDRTWFCESVHSSRESAAARVHYLNGGGSAGTPGGSL